MKEKNKKQRDKSESFHLSKPWDSYAHGWHGDKVVAWQWWQSFWSRRCAVATVCRTMKVVKNLHCAPMEKKKNKKGWTPLVVADDDSRIRVWIVKKFAFVDALQMSTFASYFSVVASQVGMPHDGLVIVTVVSQWRWRWSLSQRWLPWWSRFGVKGFAFCHGRRSRGGWFSSEAETSMVVRPVVDDTMFGVEREVRLVERVVVEASLGGLWWWRFREDLESLVVMMEAKKEQLMDVRVTDFICYYDVMSTSNFL